LTRRPRAAGAPRPGDSGRATIRPGSRSAR
jgi:hypothetical protein